MLSKAKLPAAIVLVIAALGGVSVAAYKNLAPPAPVPYNANARHFTVTDLVAKAQKDPNSLTPTEKDFYNKLPPAQIAAIKARLQQQQAARTQQP